MKTLTILGSLIRATVIAGFVVGGLYAFATLGEHGPTFTTEQVSQFYRK